jgi:hypoxia up-regulated 1
MLPNSVQAQIMSVDLGHEFFKVALMKPGSPLEIILNMHGGRKTPTAASFYETSRSFGNDAIAHFSKAPSKVPMFFHHMLGNNYTADDVKTNGRWWKDFGLSAEFYPYMMEYLEERGVPAFNLGDKSFTGEQVLANIFYYAQKRAEKATDGKPVRDVVVTVPSGSNLRFRQAIVAAAEIAGLHVLSLVHEGAAFAVERSLDLSLDPGHVQHGLFLQSGLS